MKENEIDNIIELIKHEVIPTIGCTEPMAVALCVAKSRELLGAVPEKIDVFLSADVLKNAMGVGIPGTNGMIGLPIAIALGAIIGNSEYKLEVLKDSSNEAIEKGKQLINRKIINISLKEETTESLYIEVSCEKGEKRSTAIIAKEHTNFIYLSANREVILDNTKELKDEGTKNRIELTVAKIYEFTTEAPLSKIDFILKSAEMNKDAAETSFNGNYGHQVGNLFRASILRTQDTDNLKHMQAYACAACDTRMAGAMIPVMSNSGSGNQGIATTLPIKIFAERNNNTKEELIRALIISHLVAIYIKQYLGRLSPLCGCVFATTGASCGLVYLMGGNFQQICFSIKNMIANLTGMLCDGAKPGCSMKLSTGIHAAMLSAQLAMEDIHTSSLEGIIEEDVDRCIQSLSIISTQGLNEVNKVILQIMTNKVQQL